MDPNATLSSMLSIASDIIEAQERDNVDLMGADDACELAELVQALDEWLRKGGMLPKDWAKATRKEGAA